MENAFGILANHFRVCMTPMNLSPEKVETITLACCVLHNLLSTRRTAKQVYKPPGSVDTEDPHTHTISQGEWQLCPYACRSTIASTAGQQSALQFSQAASGNALSVFHFRAWKCIVAVGHGLVVLYLLTPRLFSHIYSSLSYCTVKKSYCNCMYCTLW